MIDDLSHALDNDHEVCMIKAFDTVPHVPLLTTLQNLNIFSGGSKAISSTDPYTLQSKDMTCTLPVVSGVPQGSVLDPLLFISYINDVTSVVSTESELNLFVDDIALYRIIKSPADYEQLQIQCLLSYLGNILNSMQGSVDRYLYREELNIVTLTQPLLTVDGTPSL